MSGTGALPCLYCGKAMEDRFGKTTYPPCCLAARDMHDQGEVIADLMAVIASAAEALIGDGVEFDPAAVGDELAAYVPIDLFTDLPMSDDTRARHKPPGAPV